MTFAKELVQSAKEALAIAEGRTEPVNVATIRKSKNLSQLEFAKR